MSIFNPNMLDICNDKKGCTKGARSGSVLAHNRQMNDLHLMSELEVITILK